MSLVFQNIDPPPLTPPSECVLPPHQRHSPGGEGGGGSIFWKTRDIGLASYSIIPLRVTLWRRGSSVFSIISVGNYTLLWNLRFLLNVLKWSSSGQETVGNTFYYFSTTAKLLPAVHAMLNPVIYRSQNRFQQYYFCLYIFAGLGCFGHYSFAYVAHCISNAFHQYLTNFVK